jgi:predicted DNA-binding protein
MVDKMINVKFSKETYEKIGVESKKLEMGKGQFIRIAVIKYLNKIKNTTSGE